MPIHSAETLKYLADRAALNEKLAAAAGPNSAVHSTMAILLRSCIGDMEHENERAIIKMAAYYAEEAR